MKFSTSVSLINRNTGHKPIHNYMGQTFLGFYTLLAIHRTRKYGSPSERRLSGAVKRDFRTYIRRYTSPNENFEYGYLHSNALLTFSPQKDNENVLFAPIRPATLAA